MPAPRGVRFLGLAALVALLALSVAQCRLDMLLKPSAPHVPVLSVTPREVRDSARAGSSQVRTVPVEIVDGDGHSSFKWSASEDYRWIRLSPRDGTAPDTLTITLDPNDLSPGIYEGRVTVTSSELSDDPVDINVTFVVQRPGLDVSPMSIDHATNVNSGETFSDTLRISNSGTGSLLWTATKSVSWITLGNVAGTESGTVPVSINTAGLAAGEHHGQIVITAPGATGSPARVDVTMTIFAPGLAVNPASVRDSAPLGSTELRTQSLRVTNSGSGTVTWTASKGQPWVTLSKSAGGVPDDIGVTLDPSGLPAGTYRDTIVLTSPQALNSPVEVPIDFAIQQPGLVVSPGTITDASMVGETTRRVHTVTVSNSGGGPLAWSASANQPWIATAPSFGLAPGSFDVTLDPSGLSAGAYTGTVVIAAPGANGSPAEIPVTFTIQSSCTLFPRVPDVVEQEGSLRGRDDCDAPHRPGSLANVYSVTMNAGDALSIRLEAEFNAYLILTDGAGNVLAQNDECPGESRTACIEDFQIPATGQYLIEATSAGPGETGRLWIWLTRELAPNAPQALGQFRMDGVTGIGIGTTTPENAVVFNGTINDPNAADSVRLEIELEPLGSPFTFARTHQSGFAPVRGGSARASVTANGLTNNTGYHWQARTCDRTDRCSAWITFGENAESAADFTVSIPPPGSPPQGAKP
jgi:hypothetical protein